MPSESVGWSDGRMGFVRFNGPAEEDISRSHSLNVHQAGLVYYYMHLLFGMIE